MGLVEYETTDMQFASFMIVNGVNLSFVRRSGRKATWVFSIDSCALAELESKWPCSEEHRLFSVYKALRGQIKGPKIAGVPKSSDATRR